ncbi:colicin E3/pyocin S6 family cytotoxin [Candidatus Enterococcus lemimoniae]
MVYWGLYSENSKGNHLEVYDKHGKHIGEADPKTGELKPGTADLNKKLPK